MKKLCLILIAIAFTISYFIYTTLQTEVDGLLHIYILDIGQGDATLIVTPDGKRILIDAGPSSQALEKALDDILPSHSQTLDIISLSHPDKDHAFGIMGKENILRPKLTLLSQVLTKTQYKTIIGNLKEISPIVFANSKKDLHLTPEITLDTLYPFSAGTGSSYDPTNDGSIIQKLKYKNFSMLFTGDIGKEPLKVLTNIYGESLKSTVLKMPHHGSKNNWTENFLKSVNAPITTISSGKNNSYNHPSPETLDQLKELGTTVYDTQELGTIEIKTNGLSLTTCYIKNKSTLCQDELFLENSQKK